jgi:hypothetical protein
MDGSSNIPLPSIRTALSIGKKELPQPKSLPFLSNAKIQLKYEIIALSLVSSKTQIIASTAAIMI